MSETNEPVMTTATEWPGVNMGNERFIVIAERTTTSTEIISICCYCDSETWKTTAQSV
jgi:hypothetical protein